MYEKYYKLNDEPFRLSPDSRYCVMLSSYARASDYLQYGLARADGIVVITGAPGTGKSTLVNELLDGFSPAEMIVARLVTSHLDSSDDLYRAVAYGFGLEATDMNRATILRSLELFLIEQAQDGKHALLIVDEAQDLSLQALEDVRLLTNLQSGNQSLLQVFFLGQENLHDMVSDPSLMQLHQRVIAAAHLEPLDVEETRVYIEERLAHAGWENDPSFSDDVFPLIHRLSGGVPRRINQICSRLLLYGASTDKHTLSVADVRSVGSNLRQERLLPAMQRSGKRSAMGSANRSAESTHSSIAHGDVSESQAVDKTPAGSSVARAAGAPRPELASDEASEAGDASLESGENRPYATSETGKDAQPATRDAIAGQDSEVFASPSLSALAYEDQTDAPGNDASDGRGQSRVWKIGLAAGVAFLIAAIAAGVYSSSSWSRVLPSFNGFGWIDQRTAHIAESESWLAALQHSYQTPSVQT